MSILITGGILKQECHIFVYKFIESPYISTFLYLYQFITFYKLNHQKVVQLQPTLVKTLSMTSIN